VSFGRAPISTGPAPRARASSTHAAINAVAMPRPRKSARVKRSSIWPTPFSPGQAEKNAQSTPSTRAST
jgi:hypothetical protein